MKVLIASAGPVDPTSWYRAWGIVPDLIKRFDIEFKSYEDVLMNVGVDEKGNFKKGFTWIQALQYDVCIFQRQAGKAAVEAAKYMKECGMKIVFDLDDNVWEIPQSYAIKKGFTPEILETFDEMIDLADVVWVSTIELSRYINDPKVLVIPNAIDLNRYQFNSFNYEGSIIWRGISTHVDDLGQNRKAVEQIGVEEFWGYNPVVNPPKLKLPNARHVIGLDPAIYLNTLLMAKPKAIVVPLVDNLFNEAKSNIAWMEATLSGAVCVSNKVGEFAHVGLSFEEWNQIKDSETDLTYEHMTSISKLIEHYNLRDANNNRFHSLCDLVMPMVDPNRG
jgi:hypothetical protein